MNLKQLKTAGIATGGAIVPAETLSSYAAPPRYPVAIPQRDSSGILHYAMLGYLFLYCSRVSELIPQLRISFILLLVLLMAMGLTMRSGAILNIRSGKVLILLTLWVGLSVPFSVWLGGSLQVFRDAVQTLMTVAVMAAFIRTVPEAIRAMYTVGLAMTFAACLSFVIGADLGGRLVLGSSGSRFADPNFYCYYVLIGLPFLLLAGSISSGFKRLPWLFMTIPVLYVAVKTGSRGGLVALFASSLFLFWHSTFKQKLYSLLLLLMLVPTAGVFLPEAAMKRFATLLASEQTDDLEIERARASTQSRLALFMRSLSLTVENPIFGVGAGQFMVAEAADAKEEGKRGSWHVAHNSYTNVSSEIGIPGALLLIIAMGGAFFGLSRIRDHHPDPRLKRTALMLQASIIILAVCGAFLSFGYSGLHYALIALSGVFQAAVAAQQGAFRTPLPARVNTFTGFRR